MTVDAVIFVRLPSNNRPQTSHSSPEAKPCSYFQQTAISSLRVSSTFPVYSTVGIFCPSYLAVKPEFGSAASETVEALLGAGFSADRTGL